MHTATFQPLIEGKKIKVNTELVFQIPEWYEPKTGATSVNKSRF